MTKLTCANRVALLAVLTLLYLQTTVDAAADGGEGIGVANYEELEHESSGGTWDRLKAPYIKRQEDPCVSIIADIAVSARAFAMHSFIVDLTSSAGP